MLSKKLKEMKWNSITKLSIIFIEIQNWKQIWNYVKYFQTKDQKNICLEMESKINK